MEGIVTDEKGTKVKAAIVVLLKVKEPEDISDAETATYIETDEEGRFMIQDLNPDDKYFIEIHVERSEAGIQDKGIEEKEVSEPEHLELKPDEPEELWQEELDADEPEELWQKEHDPDDEIGDPIEENKIIDSLMRHRQMPEATISNPSVNNLYFITDVELKDKLYLYRNNFW